MELNEAKQILKDNGFLFEHIETLEKEIKNKFPDLKVKKETYFGGLNNWTLYKRYFDEKYFIEFTTGNGFEFEEKIIYSFKIKCVDSDQVTVFEKTYKNVARHADISYYGIIEVLKDFIEKLEIVLEG